MPTQPAIPLSLCGIFGCVLHDGKEAAPLIHAALKRLEYRGYDSVGEVTIADGALAIKKDSGRLDEVHAKYNLDLLPGPVGVGHTRWATHGRPVKENSHPLVDCKSRIAVVHNGIIENYLDLKRELETKGHRFVSRTDTEVVPHMVEEYLGQGLSLEEAFRKTINRLEGAYSIVLTSVEKPKTILCARQESPLVAEFFDLLGDRFARSVARFGFNADQYRCVTCLVSLHGGGELETVCRYYAVVVIGGDNKGRRIFCSRLDILQRGILINRLELLGII